MDAPKSPTSHQPAPARPRTPPPARWPAPAPSNPWLLGGAVAIGVLAGATALTRPGAQWPVLAIGAAVLIRFCCPDPAPLPLAERRWRTVLAGIALSLLVTLALRDSGPLIIVVAVACCMLLALALIPGGRAVAVLAAPVLGAVAWARALIWLPALPRTDWRLAGRAGPLLRGAGLAIALLFGVGWLLGSADHAFAGLTNALLPDLDLDDLPARVIVGGLVFTVVGAVCFGIASPPAVFGRGRDRPRLAVEWAPPVGVLVAVLGAFLVVQAAVLFGTYPSELVSGDLTPADRARHGFGQLVCVSVIVAATLAWAAAQVAATGGGARARDRRLLIVLGGLLLLELEVLVASALRRMYLYEEAFGWTRLRVDVAAFEIWLAVAILVAAGLWLAGRGALVPRVAAASAGAALLVFTLIGPDAIVARASVERFEATGKIDTPYLGGLSADAVPALSTLPEPHRSCVLGGRSPYSAPWYAFNLSRVRADAVLTAKPTAFVERSEPCWS